MQHKNGPDDLSAHRLALRRLLTTLKRSLKVVFGRSSMVKGNVYELARKCGKPNCACRDGELHRSMVLSWSHKGKTKLKPIHKDKLASTRIKSQEYLRFRSARAKVTKICEQILSLLDQIEKIRREEP